MTEDSNRVVPRRTVARGAAWAVPVIAIGTFAPASAASTPSSVCAGMICSVPWQNTYNNFRNTNGHDGMYLPYVMYPTSASAAGAFNQSTPALAAGDPLGDASYPPTKNVSGVYQGGAGCNTAACYGKGSVVTVVMTELTGPTLARGTNTWPFLVPRDNHLGGCGQYFECTGYDAQTSTNSNQYFGVPSTGGGRQTWTWTLTWTADTCNIHDGCDAITYDIRMPSSMPGVSTTNMVSWRITTTSPAGTNTFETTPHA